MLQDIDQKEVEKKAFKSVFQDGVWDIFLADILLGAAIASLIEKYYLVIPIYILVVLFLWVIKKRVTVPRMGLIEFDSERERNTKKMWKFLLISVLIIYLTPETIFSGSLIDMPQWVMTVALSLSVISCLIAYYLGFERLYYYAVMTSISIPLAFFVEVNGHMSGELIFCIQAFIMLSIGQSVFVRFLHDHPLPPKTVDQ